MTTNVNKQTKRLGEVASNLDDTHSKLMSSNAKLKKVLNEVKE